MCQILVLGKDIGRMIVEDVQYLAATSRFEHFSLSYAQEQQKRHVILFSKNFRYLSKLTLKKTMGDIQNSGWWDASVWVPMCATRGTRIRLVWNLLGNELLLLMIVC